MSQLRFLACADGEEKGKGRGDEQNLTIQSVSTHGLA